MKKFILIPLLSMLLGSVLAQPPGGMPPMAQLPENGHIFGKLVDSAGKAIPDASVLLMQAKMDTTEKKLKETLLRGGTTAANGEFSFESLPVFGKLTLKISATGYQPQDVDVSFMKKPAGNMPPPGQVPTARPSFGGDFSKDLGNVTMAAEIQQLAGVVVTSTSSRLKLDIDKKVFNVDQNIVTAGGTAADVMRNVPSVNVDLDGNVTLRNASPQLYIDGRPTTLSLDQIPADAIESVEVITNPSARYDASGGNAGILNIVLKKNKKTGYNGNVSLGVNKRGGVNGGASINVRENKLNFSANVFGNQMKNRNTGTTNVQNLLTNPNLFVDQTNSTRMSGGFLFGKIGMDYFLTNRATISAGLIKVHGEMNPTSMLQSDSSFAGGNYISFSERMTQQNRVFNAYGGTIGFKYQFPKKGEELTADANLFSGTNNSNALYQTTVYDYKGGNTMGGLDQKIIGTGTNQFFTIQTDYVKPLFENGKLETGARAQLRSLTNGQGNYVMNSNTGIYDLISSSSTNYKNTDNVYAAYVSFTNSIRDFGYQVGLRAESSNYEGELTDTKEVFVNKYPISLFPSVFLSQKLKNKQELQMSYTRRINRPFFMQVIPFIDSTDQLNWSRGNAGLKPEFTNSLEASWMKTLKGNNTLLASVYYKYTTDLITQYIDSINTTSGEVRPISTYVNANSSRSMGLELTSQNTLTKWWDMNTNVNFYNSKINTDNISGASQDAMWSWFAKMNNSFKLPANFKLQLSGTYQSKTNLPVSSSDRGPGNGPPMGGSQSAAQGYIKAFYGIDAAIQKSFLKNNAASVTLSVNDIFRTRSYEQYSASNYFISNSYRLNDAPMVRLNFAFKFGQMDMSLFKRKNNNDGMQNAMQMQ